MSFGRSVRLRRTSPVRLAASRVSRPRSLVAAPTRSRRPPPRSRSSRLYTVQDLVRLFPQWAPPRVAPLAMQQVAPLVPQREALAELLATPSPSGVALAPKLEPLPPPPLEQLPVVPSFQAEPRPMATSLASLLRPLAVVAPEPVAELVRAVEPARPPVAVFVEPAPLPPESFPAALPSAAAPLVRAAAGVVSVSPPAMGGVSVSRLAAAERINPLDLFEDQQWL